MVIKFFLFSAGAQRCRLEPNVFVDCRRHLLLLADIAHSVLHYRELRVAASVVQVFARMGG